MAKNVYVMWDGRRIKIPLWIFEKPPLLRTFIKKATGIPRRCQIILRHPDDTEPIDRAAYSSWPPDVPVYLRESELMELDGDSSKESIDEFAAMGELSKDNSVARKLISSITHELVKYRAESDSSEDSFGDTDSVFNDESCILIGNSQEDQEILEEINTEENCDTKEADAAIKDNQVGKVETDEKDDTGAEWQTGTNSELLSEVKELRSCVARIERKQQSLRVLLYSLPCLLFVAVMVHAAVVGLSIKSLEKSLNSPTSVSNPPSGSLLNGAVPTSHGQASQENAVPIVDAELDCASCAEQSHPIFSFVEETEGIRNSQGTADKQTGEAAEPIESSSWVTSSDQTSSSGIDEPPSPGIDDDNVEMTLSQFVKERVKALWPSDQLFQDLREKLTSILLIKLMNRE